MGGHTYDRILNMDVQWPYKDKTVYVITPYPSDDNDKIYFISENVVETISGLCEKDGKDIWLASGSKLLFMLLERNMVDEMIINCFPVIHGNGTPLFPNHTKESEWKAKDSLTYKNGVSQITYTK